MAHQRQQEFLGFVKSLYPVWFDNQTVLDVGSLDINGNARWAFENCQYTGLDIIEGNNVDIVKPIEKYKPGLLYDVVISCEMLEHCKKWLTALNKMYDLLKPNGLLLITAAGEIREEHGTFEHKPADSPATNDYYRNITNKMFSNVLIPSMFKVYFMRQIEDDFQFFGIKI